MLPVIKNRIAELEKEFVGLQRERLVQKYAALNSKSYVRWIDDHRAEIDALEEQKNEKDDLLNMLEEHGLDSDDKGVVLGMLKCQLHSLRQIDKNSDDTGLAKKCISRRLEIARLIEMIERANND